MSDNGTPVTEFRLTQKLDSFEFIQAFESHFIDGRAIPAGVLDGYVIFHLHVPRERKGDVKPFIDGYARERRGETAWKLI